MKLAAWGQKVPSKKTCIKCTDLDHPAHALNIMWEFTLHSYILTYPMIQQTVKALTVDVQADLGLGCPHMPEDMFWKARPTL